jgi:hypothetical protein
MMRTLRKHWPEYVLEALGLMLFMISAGGSATLLEYPQSPIHHRIADPVVRRSLQRVGSNLEYVFTVKPSYGDSLLSPVSRGSLAPPCASIASGSCHTDRAQEGAYWERCLGRTR